MLKRIMLSLTVLGLSLLLFAAPVLACEVDNCSHDADLTFDSSVLFNFFESGYSFEVEWDVFEGIKQIYIVNPSGIYVCIEDAFLSDELVAAILESLTLPVMPRWMCCGVLRQHNAGQVSRSMTHPTPNGQTCLVLLTYMRQHQWWACNPSAILIREFRITEFHTNCSPGGIW